MSERSRLDDLFEQLRLAEKLARARLTAGCADDTSKIERYFDHPMDVARRNARDALGGMGSGMDPDLKVNLLREAFERIGAAYAEAVCANAGLRLRARFRNYVDEIAASEFRISETLTSLRLVRSKRVLPRMFPIEQLRIENVALPAAPQYETEVKDWLASLRKTVRQELAVSTRNALTKILEHGYARLGIVKTRIDLALCQPARRTPSNAPHERSA